MYCEKRKERHETKVDRKKRLEGANKIKVERRDSLRKN